MSILTATGTVTVNAAFLQEIKEVNEDLWQLLEEARSVCVEPALIRSQRRRVNLMFAQLRDKLAMHFALEEAYGYFDDPVFVAPRLSEKAETLRSQHETLYIDICELADYVERMSYRGRLASCATELSQRFMEFYDRIQEHEAEENELILQAYDEDIGVGD